MKTRTLSPLVGCSVLLLAACSSQAAAAVTPTADANQYVQATASPPEQLQSNRSHESRLDLPLADWYTAWSGTPAGDGLRTVTGMDHTLVTVMFRNAGQQTHTWNFDLFILSVWPGRVPVHSTLAFKNFAGQVWDWEQANPKSTHTVTLGAGGASTIQLDWQYSNLQGEPVANGRYYVFLAVSKPSGELDGFSSQVLDVQR